MVGTHSLRLACIAALLVAGTLPAQGSQLATAVVTGRVLDSLGEPIVQATVRASRTIDDRVLATQKTDGSGVFVLSGVPLDEGVVVRAEATGHTHARTWLTPAQPRESMPEDLVLHDAGTVTGVVVDAAGSPIVGACVSAATPFARPRAAVVEATTDAQGRFTIDAAPLGELLVLTWKRGFVLDEHRLLLRDRSEQRIALTDQGGASLDVGVERVAAAERGSVRLRLERFVDGCSQELPSPLGICVLDERCKATVEGLLPGKYQMIPISPLVSVRVRAKEPASAKQVSGTRVSPERDANLTLVAGQRQEVTFEAAKPQAVRITGTLRAEDGTALGGKSLRFSSSNGVRVGRVSCGASGAFAFVASLSQGERLWPRLLDDDLLLVNSPTDGNGYIVAGDQLVLELSARPPVVMRGKVLSANGAPLGAVRVAMTAQLLGRGNSITLAPERHEWASGRSDPDGTFVLRWDDDRTRRLGEPRLEARDAQGCAVAPLDDTAATLALRLKPAARLEGVVRDALGQPIGGMGVRLTSLGDNKLGANRPGGIYAVTTRDGRYCMATLAEGAYRLELFSGGRTAAETREPITIAPGEQKRGVDFKLPK
jgi:hypothetical protein